MNREREGGKCNNLKTIKQYRLFNHQFYHNYVIIRHEVLLLLYNLKIKHYVQYLSKTLPDSFIRLKKHLYLFVEHEIDFFPHKR